MAIPEKGIPSIKTTDGPNGARGEFFTNGTPVSIRSRHGCGYELTR
jgi:beta-glucosidase